MMFNNILRIIRFFYDKEVNISKKLLFFIPILYLLFPFDFIPDYFPLLGYLDDIAVFVLMWPILRSFLNEHDNGTGSTKDNTKKYKDAIDIDKDNYDIK